MNEELFPDIAKKPGQRVKAWCCEKELDCELRIFSNGTKHAYGTCPICGKTNAKQQRLAPNLEDLKHRLLWIGSMIRSMPAGENKDEAIAMVERFSDSIGEEL